MYLSTTTGPSLCHSPLPDKGKLFCLFVCCGTLSCYGLGAFSLPIPHGMHLMVPTQLCFFLVVCHPSRTLPPKEPEQEPRNRSFPSLHRQTMSSYVWPITSPCPVLAGYRLVRSGPYACLYSMYVQKSVCCSYVCHGWPAQSAIRFLTIFWFPFLYGLPCLGIGPFLMVGFAFLQPTLFSTTIFCHITLSFLLRSCLPQSCWASLGLPFILLSMAQYGHWFFYYITGGLLCPICFPFGVSGPFAFLGLPQLFS